MPPEKLDEPDDLEWLASWYRNHCDGSWEITYGLLLEPFSPASRGAGAASERRARGYRLTIELTGTEAAGHAPRTLLLDSMDGGWLSCSLTRERFTGSGDAAKVEQIIGIFRRWIEPARPGSRPARQVETLSTER